jgi:hypothetical protein
VEDGYLDSRIGSGWCDDGSTLGKGFSRLLCRVHISSVQFASGQKFRSVGEGFTFTSLQVQFRSICGGSRVASRSDAN